MSEMRDANMTDFSIKYLVLTKTSCSTNFRLFYHRIIDIYYSKYIHNSQVLNIIKK